MLDSVKEAVSKLLAFVETNPRAAINLIMILIASLLGFVIYSLIGQFNTKESDLLIKNEKLRDDCLKMERYLLYKVDSTDRAHFTQRIADKDSAARQAALVITNLNEQLETLKKDLKHSEVSSAQTRKLSEVARKEVIEIAKQIKSQ